jgi:hypothetical protein
VPTAVATDLSGVLGEQVRDGAGSLRVHPRCRVLVEAHRDRWRRVAESFLHHLDRNPVENHQAGVRVAGVVEAELQAERDTGAAGRGGGSLGGRPPDVVRAGRPPRTRATAYSSAMRVKGIDERKLCREGTGVNFVVFIYEGGDDPNESSSVDGPRSWSVDSYLLTDADFTEVLAWLGENLPGKACYSVGVVCDPPRPTADSEVAVVWVLGADLLNSDPRYWTSGERRIAEGMLSRRHRVSIP